MKKDLLIVESPTKANKLKEYLGDRYEIVASYGHIVDLSKGGKHGLGINLTNFDTHYSIIKEKFQTLETILQAVDRCNNIYLLSDPDREGEAISYHIKTLLESSNKVIKRAEFNEITKDAVLQGIANARDIDMNLFHAQETRRILDRIVGFMASPLLSNIFETNLSAGRVQSVVLKMICDREQEIKIFKPQEYWNLSALFETNSKQKFSAKYVKKLNNKQETEKVKQQLSNAKFQVISVKAKEKKENPLPPLITAKLQQLMAKEHSFDAERTMKVAQNLYENGYVSYIRTDSTRISDKAVQEVRKWLSANDLSYPKSAKTYTPAKSAQDAHECIRPTNINNLPNKITLMPDEKLVYGAIWRYFVASQMNPAIWSGLEVQIENITNPKHTFKVSGKALKEPGFLHIFGYVADGAIDLPLLKQGEILLLDNLKSEQKFTQPVPRYTEASLLKELERRQIGRPSTFANVLKTVANRAYVEKTNNTYHSTELGKDVSKILTDFFTFMNYNYSAELEGQLDKIADGSLDYLTMLNDFFNSFKIEITKALKKHNGMVCEKCGNPMFVKINHSNKNKFFSCSNYPWCFNAKSIETEIDRKSA